MLSSSCELCWPIVCRCRVVTRKRQGRKLTQIIFRCFNFDRKARIYIIYTNKKTTRLKSKVPALASRTRLNPWLFQQFSVLTEEGG